MSDDLEIVRRVQRGETQAFALLVEKYHRHLLNFIFRLVRDESIVEDIGQEVFLSIYRTLATFDESRAVPFAAWIYIVARNRCISELRRRRGKVFQLADELEGLAATAPGSPEDLTIDAEESQALAATLELLPEPYRRALLGSLQGDTLEEQALVEGIAPGTAKSRLSRAREKMRRLLGERQGRMRS
jgi:RNA polymerase sigma-70 factor, ECF subfamily